MTTATEDRVIELEGIGPHKERTRISAPPGKITVLTGPNGIGKTQVLDTVDAIQRREAGRKLSSSDGTVGGTASFAGVTIRVARGGSNRRSGELVVESLEDRLSIATFVDPGKKDPLAADEQRIRALLLLAGARADIAAFSAMLPEGEEWEAIVSTEALKETDVVKQAARVKADFEAAARRVEEARVKAETEKAAYVKANEGLDLSLPSDARALDVARDEAHENLITIRENRRAGLESMENYELACWRLDELEQSYTGPTVDEATGMLAVAIESQTEQSVRVRELEAELAKARAALVGRNHQVQAAEQRLQAAQGHEETIKAWRYTIEAGAAVPPTEDDVVECQLVYEEAKAAADRGVLVREAIKRQKAIELASDRITALHARAESLRAAARNTQVVLSRMVGDLGVPLRVDGQLRLLAEHVTRGECYFDELSMGEKWSIGIGIVLARAGEEPAMLVIPQEAFESLDRRNRKRIMEAIEGTNISILTAEASQDPDQRDLAAAIYE